MTKRKLSVFVITIKVGNDNFTVVGAFTKKSKAMEYIKDNELVPPGCSFSQETKGPETHIKVSGVEIEIKVTQQELL